MEYLIPLLIVLFVLLAIMTLVGHGIWLFLAWLVRLLSGTDNAPPPQTLSIKSSTAPLRCVNCKNPLRPNAPFCGVCAACQPVASQEKLFHDLESTLRQLQRLLQQGVIDETNYRVLKTRIENEREQILFPRGHPGSAKQPPLFDRQPPPPRPEPRPSGAAAPPPKQPVPATPPSFAHAQTQASAEAKHQYGAWSKDSDKAQIKPPVLKPPRKPFAEVLESFMEQSNIRWGEIIGGILIVGCSTALVISLWAQISRVPVLKFLIFTTVTAALFGVGFYTEHRWKLPTTSRGILTIATLLVPLNFLAIAAVSGSAAPPNAMIIGSELIAPAIFLCLVYFAGRVITPSWPQLLAAGVLASSTGQLLVRHFAAPDNSPKLLFALAAFPVLCYAGSIAWMLRKALADDEIRESETNEVFITLGASTFAAALPIGLLLYRSGPVGISMMHLAPLVTLGGMPLLATGTLVWRKVKQKELVAARTAGTAIAIFGAATVLAGMILAWPNPASIVPAALINFAVFTALAVFLDLPMAHAFAAICLTLAYVVAIQAITGQVHWQNLRETSLLNVTLSVRTGQALVLPFVLFTLVYEWLRRTQRRRDASSYLGTACAVAIVSVALATMFGALIAGDPYRISLLLAFYAFGAFWFASRERLVAFTWIATLLLFASAVQTCVSLFSLRSPWQAAFLLFAAAGIIGALVLRRLGKQETEKLFVMPLQNSAVAAAVLATLFLLIEITSYGFEPASLLATRAFWLAAVWLGLLFLARATIFFTAFQMTIVLGAILSTKAFLQRFEWYAYQPNAWLYPHALEIQGSVLALICLGWIVVRVVARRRLATPAPGSGARASFETIRQSLTLPIAFDHLLAITLMIGFEVLAVFGSFTGLSRELTTATRTPATFDLAGFPHALIFGAGGWLLFAILLTVMLGNLWERRHRPFLLSAIVTLWILCPLLAGRFESQNATASAWRWSAATLLLLISILYALRKKLFGSVFFVNARRNLVVSRAILLFLTLTPLILITLSVVIDDINYVPARGPQTGIFFSMGAAILYGFPLIFVAAALAIHAVNQRAAVFAFTAGLIVNLTVTVVYIVTVTALNGLMTRSVLVNALQLNAIAAACVALVWMATRVWWMTENRLPLGEGTSAKSARVVSESEHVLLTCQKWFAMTLLSLLIVPLVLHLIALPTHAGRATFAAGSLTGWLALLLTVAAVIAFDKICTRPISLSSFTAPLLAAGALASFAIARFGVPRWAGFHVLIGAFVLIAWLLLLVRDLPKKEELASSLSRLGLGLADDWEWDSELATAAVGVIVVLISLRGPFVDPLGAWWSIVALLAMSALGAALNWINLRRSYLYATGILVVTAVSIWFIKYQDQKNGRAFIEANIIALGSAGVLCLVFELRARRLSKRLAGSTALSFHNLAALLSLLAIGCIAAFDLNQDFAHIHRSFSPVLDWVSLTALTLLMAACLWDREAKYAVAGLYLIGLVKLAQLLHYFNLSPQRLTWGLTMALAIHALGAAILWRARRPIIAWANKLKIPPRMDPEAGELLWLSYFNSLVVTVVVMLALWVDLNFTNRSLRAIVSLAVIAQAFTFGLLAQGKWRVRWQRAAIAMLLVGIVFFGWSFLTPGTASGWLHRAVILMATMFAVVGLFGAELGKLFEREPDWTKAFRDCVPGITFTGIASLTFVLGTEVYYQIEFGAVRINPLALATVALTLAVGVVICIFFALSPVHDPLGLSERGRCAYVYVAEIMLALLFMHIRLTMPWLFTGFFERYWPLVIIVIAYAGVATSELLRRRQLLVLAEPIQRTGVLLPLLPVIGFWFAASQVDYSFLLFVIGGLYGAVAIVRRSFMFGLLAALAANGGLWYLLHRTSDYQFWQHPQLWLIPMALSVLIAAHLNRKDFSDAQMAGTRYLTLVVIYVSSTADIFINGVAQSPWLPLVLAGLSLAGVFAGMIFRIRAFLLLGSVFLLLAIATMINYASVNFGWTWLWYVAGIVTGAVIIATFAVFEKKRADVLRVVDGFKEWER
jgi:hypothetical protein